MILGVLKMGSLAHFLSFAVTTGFTSAAAVIIATSQLQVRAFPCRAFALWCAPMYPLCDWGVHGQHLLGITHVPRYAGAFASLKEFVNVVSRIGESYWVTVVISLACAIILLAVKWWKQNKAAKFYEVGDSLLLTHPVGCPPVMPACPFPQQCTVQWKRTLVRTLVDMSSLLVTILGGVIAIICDSAGVIVRASACVVLSCVRCCCCCCMLHL